MHFMHWTSQGCGRPGRRINTRPQSMLAAALTRRRISQRLLGVLFEDLKFAPMAGRAGSQSHFYP